MVKMRLWNSNPELKFFLQTHRYHQSELYTADKPNNDLLLDGESPAEARIPYLRSWKMRMPREVKQRVEVEIKKKGKHLLTCFFPCFGNPSWFKMSLSSFILKYASLSCNRQGKDRYQSFKSNPLARCAHEVDYQTPNIWSIGQKLQVNYQH